MHSGHKYKHTVTAISGTRRQSATSQSQDEEALTMVRKTASERLSAEMDRSSNKLGDQVHKRKL
eukprot:7328187-Prorocentrum_lima.AAC.1